jgi:hypothetical protein
MHDKKTEDTSVQIFAKEQHGPSEIDALSAKYHELLTKARSSTDEMQLAACRTQRESLKKDYNALAQKLGESAAIKSLRELGIEVDLRIIHVSDCFRLIQEIELHLKEANFPEKLLSLLLKKINKDIHDPNVNLSNYNLFLTTLNRHSQYSVDARNKLIGLLEIVDKEESPGNTTSVWRTFSDEYLLSKDNIGIEAEIDRASNIKPCGEPLAAHFVQRKLGIKSDISKMSFRELLTQYVKNEWSLSPIRWRTHLDFVNNFMKEQKDTSLNDKELMQKFDTALRNKKITLNPVGTLALICDYSNKKQSEAVISMNGALPKLRKAALLKKLNIGDVSTLSANKLANKIVSEYVKPNVSFSIMRPFSYSIRHHNAELAYFLSQHNIFIPNDSLTAKQIYDAVLHFVETNKDKVDPQGTLAMALAVLNDLANLPSPVVVETETLDGSSTRSILERVRGGDDSSSLASNSSSLQTNPLQIQGSSTNSSSSDINSTNDSASETSENLTPRH